MTKAVTKRGLVGLASMMLGAATLVGMSGAAFAADPIIVGLVTKTNTNPYFAKMQEGAEAEAAKLGVKLLSFAGKFDGDSDSQIAAIENLVSAGAKGILVTPSDSKAIVPAILEARKAGVLVIALDTPVEPIDAVDATFGTDNFRAGLLIGEWAAKTLGDEAKTAKVAFLDAVDTQPAGDAARDQGFMVGYGIDPKDKSRYLDEDDPRIVGHYWTKGAEDGGRTGMENLLQLAPDLRVVYTVNEPSAAGAYEALKAAGVEGKVLMTSIDGGCPGVKNVKDGVIGATSMQFPLRMASLGVEAVVKYVQTGEKPKPTEGLSFFDTGIELVTDKPVEGLKSITSEEGLKLCWG